MDVTALLEVLAESGLSDDVYVRAVATVRVLAQRSAAASLLAETVLEFESYQPAAVLDAVGLFLAPPVSTPA